MKHTAKKKLPLRREMIVTLSQLHYVQAGYLEPATTDGNNGCQSEATGCATGWTGCGTC